MDDSGCLHVPHVRLLTKKRSVASSSLNPIRWYCSCPERKRMNILVVNAALQPIRRGEMNKVDLAMIDNTLSIDACVEPQSICCPWRTGQSAGDGGGFPRRTCKWCNRCAGAVQFTLLFCAVIQLSIFLFGLPNLHSQFHEVKNPATRTLAGFQCQLRSV